MGERIEVECAACSGTGETEGYPGYTPQGGPDGARYTCWACGGTKRLTAVAAEGTRTEALLRFAEAALEYLRSGFWSASVSLQDAVRNAGMAREKMEQAGAAVRAFDREEPK
jgi:hypothetical protein